MTSPVTVNQTIQDSVGEDVELLIRGGPCLAGKVLSADGHSVVLHQAFGGMDDWHTTVVLQDVSAVRRRPS